MRWQVAIAAALIFLCASAVVAWVSVGGPVAWRGEELGTITIHASGTLAEIAAELHSQRILFLTADDAAVSKRHVSLDFDEATPTEVVTAICRQTGCVFQATGLGLSGLPFPSFSLREGDWDADPRPQTTVGDYRICIEQVQLYQRADVQFRWGDAEPERAESQGMTVKVLVEAANREAAARLFGLSGAASVLTDAGEVLERTGRERWIVQQPSDLSMVGLSFPRPVRQAEAIKEFRGKLAVYSKITEVSCEVTPDDTGVAKKLGDLDCTLVDWKEEGDNIRVTTERVRPESEGRGRLRALLKGPDAQVLASRGYSAHSDGTRTTTWTFAKPEDWQPVALILDGYLRYEPVKYLEFCIRDIPLP